MSEANFRKRVDKFLKTLKRTHAESIQQVSIGGTPDKLLCVNGHFVALELKDRGKQPTALQRRFLDRTERAGGFAFCADPDNWPYVSEIIRALDSGQELLQSPRWRDLHPWKKT